MTWHDHRHDLPDLWAAIAQIATGARALAARGEPGDQADLQPANRAQPGVYRLDGNLAGLAVIERHAFWPLLFADPTQQPLTIKPPLDRLAQLTSEPIEWQQIAQAGLSAKTLQGAPDLNRWLQEFEDVLLIDRQRAAQPPLSLTPVYRGSYAELFRITRRAGGPRESRRAGASG